ncbi:helix-turn-helix domain-containing protein [Rhizobium sp. CCGE 510]|uniref:AraC family transcriptional regulator n=1 Tax=Rhizobium sp. CCGE 510 TaxID=1132836 RepID=UPI001F0A981A|nr:helix-turn-helix domain-containing protein [Rhizobium sp. CCGE 510]
MMWRVESVPYKIDHFSLKGTCSEELAEALSRLSPQSPAHVEGDKTTAYDIHAIANGPIAVIAAHYEGDLTVQHQGPAEANIIMLPLYGRSVVTVDGRQILSEGRRGVFVNSMSASTTQFIGPRKHLGLRISHDELTRRLARRLNTPIRGSLDFSAEIDLSVGFGSLLVQLVAVLYAGLREGTLLESPIALNHLTETTMELLIEAAQHRYSPELCRVAEPPLPKAVKRAVDYMRANIARPLSLDEIATACGVSRRTLQSGFRNFRNTTPLAFLQHLRLESVHQELMTGEPGLSVKQVALKWGFIHRGRFSADYRKRYGVYPSETLRISEADCAD